MSRVSLPYQYLASLPISSLEGFSPYSQNVDMSAEMSSESMEVITMAIDKHAQTKNYEVEHIACDVHLHFLHTQ